MKIVNDEKLTKEERNLQCKAKELSKKYNKKEALLFNMINECNEMGYNEKKIQEMLDEFYLL